MTSYTEIQIKLCLIFKYFISAVNRHIRVESVNFDKYLSELKFGTSNFMAFVVTHIVIRVLKFLWSETSQSMPDIMLFHAQPKSYNTCKKTDCQQR